jgi:hypothetical protein
MVGGLCDECEGNVKIPPGLNIDNTNGVSTSHLLVMDVLGKYIPIMLLSYSAEPIFLISLYLYEGEKQ